MFGDFIALFFQARLALLGQFLALVTIVIPLVAGDTSVLPKLVLIASSATLLVPFISLSSANTIPTLSGDRASQKIKSSAVVIAVSLLVGLGVFWLGLLIASELFQISGLILLAASSQATYVNASAIFVRLGFSKEISASRFLNNLVTLALTIWAALSGGEWSFYAFAAFVGFLAPLVLVAMRRHLRSRIARGIREQFSSEKISWRFLEEIRLSAKPTVISFLTTLWSQVPYVITPFLGDLTGAWAIATRFSAGLETLGGQIVGLLLDVRRSAAVRQRDLKEKRYLRNFSYFVGGIVGACGGLVVSSVALVGSHRYSPVDSAGVGLLVFLLVLTQVLSAVNSQYLLMLDGWWAKLIMDTFKASGLLVALFMLSGTSRIWGASVVMIAWVIIQYRTITLKVQVGHPRIRRSYSMSLRHLVNSVPASWFYRVFDNLLIWLVSAAPKTAKSKSVDNVILAPSSMLNLGDQALVLGALHNISGKTLVIFTSNDGSAYVNESADNSEVILGLFSFNPFTSALAFRRAARLIASASNFFVVGADIMDGAYTTQQSIRRFALAKYAVRVGVSARIFGFSWSPKVSPVIQKTVESLPSEVVLCMRDPDSLRRISELGLSSLPRLTADLAFSLKVSTGTSPIKSWIESQQRQARPIVGMNLNGSQSSSYPHLQESYVQIAQAFLDAGWSIVFISHDSRISVSDTQANVSVASALETNHVNSGALIDNVQHVLDTLRQLDLVISGRMHLSILSLLSGLPAISVSDDRLGKVLGLYKLFRIEQLVFSASDSKALLDGITPQSVESEIASWQTTIRASLPTIKELSKRNFE